MNLVPSIPTGPRPSRKAASKRPTGGNAGAAAQTSHVVTEIDDTDPDFVSAVGRAFAILRCFHRQHAKVLGNKDLAQMTGLPKSTIARLTYTLTRLGYLEFLPEAQKYTLGIGTLTLGQAYLAGLDVRDVARPLMQELADSAGATVALGAPHGTDMVFLEICHGNPVFMMRVAVGQRVPHGMTALGRAYIAALPPVERERYGAEYRPRVPAADWARLTALSDQAIADVEDHGFCCSLGDWSEEVFAAGVPMVSADGHHILAFSCSGPVHEMSRERLHNDIGPRLVSLRDRVHAALGGIF